MQIAASMDLGFIHMRHFESHHLPATAARGSDSFCVVPLQRCKFEAHMWHEPLDCVPVVVTLKRNAFVVSGIEKQETQVVWLCMWDVSQ